MVNVQSIDPCAIGPGETRPCSRFLTLKYYVGSREIERRADQDNRRPKLRRILPMS